MKRRILALFMAATMMMGLAACGSGGQEKEAAQTPDTAAAETQKPDTSGSAEAGSGEEVTLKVLTTQENVGKDIMEAFTAEHPNIKIDYTYVPAADYPAKFSALASSGDLPDCFWTQAGYYTDQIKDGMLMDLTEALDSECYEGDMTWRESYEPALLGNLEDLVEANLGEGESVDYGVPFSMTTIAVLYDKKIYEKLSLSVPENWEQFMENCKVLHENGYSAVSHQSVSCVDWFPRLFWDQFCRPEMDEQGKKFEDGSMTFKTESVQKGLTSFKEMWDAGYFPESLMTADLQAVQQSFIQGKLAQIIITPSKLEYIMDNAPDTMELATYVLPGIAGLPPRSLGGSSNIWSVSAKTEHPDEALLLVKYLTSRTNFGTANSLRFTPSGLKGMEFDDSIKEIMAPYNEAAQNGFCPDIYVPVTVSTEIKTSFMTDLLPNYLSGQYDLEYVCTELQTLYDEYLSNQ